jgi:hypothetical protein
MPIRIVNADLTWLRRYVARWLRATLHGRSNTIHRITRFGRTGAGSLPAQWNIGAEDCVSFAAASLAGAYL